MLKPSSYCDARKTKQRVPRLKHSCTSCGKVLPKSRREWGLVWDNNVTGICEPCLISIRAEIGYKYNRPSD